MRTPTFFAIVALTSARIALGATATTPVGTAIGQQLPQVKAELIDLSGKTEKVTPFDSAKSKRVTAYVMVGTHCPSTQAYSERMAALTKTYKAKPVDFVFVYPNREDNHEAKIAFHKEKSLGGRLIDDQDGKIARLLGAQRTTEVFIADKKGVLVYHGAVDDSRDDVSAVKQRYVATALDQTLAGKPVTTNASQVFA